MRLLYLCSDFGISPQGTKGASVHLRAITRALAELGHEVLLLSPKDGPGGDHPVRHILPGGCPPAQKYGKLLKHWLVGHGFSDSIAKELRPLIYNAWVTERAMEVLEGKPPDAIVERLSLFGHVGIDLAEALDVPLIVEVNAPLTEEADRYRSLQLTELAREMEQRVLDYAAAVTVVSEPLADRLARDGLDRDRLHVIPNGTDIQLFMEAPSRDLCRAQLVRHMPESGISDGIGSPQPFVVGFVGSLKEWHGVDVLLSAFSLLLRQDPSARLLIVGSGPMEQRLRQQAAETGLNGTVVFTGAVSHDQIPRLLRLVDVAVAPFKDVPGFYFSPIKLFEYMASGACVLASRLGQIADVIEDGVNGLLAAPGDAGDLYRLLDQARRSPDRRRRMGACALETVRARFSWSHSARTLMGVIETALIKAATVREGAGRTGRSGSLAWAQGNTTAKIG